MDYSPAKIAADLGALGVRPGDTVMLHASVKAVGRVMGGPDSILSAFFDVLTPSGTLMMYAGWEDIPDFVTELPPAERDAYYAHHPAFDPATSRAVRDNSILAEFFRTTPGTRRSPHPEASMIARGAHAEVLTAVHPLNYAYGVDSPLDRLVTLGGRVLMLGAPLDTITLLHYAEFRARMRHKNVNHYQCPILQNGQKQWITIEDFDTGETHDDYEFEQIAREYFADGHGQRGTVGDADSYLFEAPHLTNYAITWLESRFGA